MGDWKVCSVQSRQKKNQERSHLHWMKKVKTENLQRGHFPLLMEGLIGKIRKLIFFKLKKTYLVQLTL